MKTNKWLKSFYKLFKSKFLENGIILSNFGMKAKDHRVNLHWWDSCTEVKPGKYKYNLGDNLSAIVVSYMLQKKGLSLDSEISGKKHLYAVGSILAMGHQNATIWGSGILRYLYKKEQFLQIFPIRRMDVRAVRGPKTRDYILRLGHSCPKVYGDPAILMPLIYDPPLLETQQDFIIIPHFSKNDYYVEKYGEDKVVSMITDNYESVLTRIKNSKKVISGSLHGIILSESYRVPAIFLRDRASDRDFKYDDWYSSTNREHYFSSSSVEEAIKMDPMPLPDNLDELREGLINSFPYDLWD